MIIHQGTEVVFPNGGTGMYLGYYDSDGSQEHIALVNINGTPCIANGVLLVGSQDDGVVVGSYDDAFLIGDFDNKLLMEAVTNPNNAVSVLTDDPANPFFYTQHPAVFMKTVLYSAGLNLPVVQHTWRPS